MSGVESPLSKQPRNTRWPIMRAAMALCRRSVASGRRWVTWFTLFVAAQGLMLGKTHKGTDKEMPAAQKFAVALNEKRPDLRLQVRLSEAGAATVAVLVQG